MQQPIIMTLVVMPVPGNDAISPQGIEEITSQLRECVNHIAEVYPIVYFCRSSKGVEQC